MKMALMVIDLQKAYLNEYTERYMKSACEYINAVIPLFRKNKLPIIWVQHKEFRACTHKDHYNLLRVEFK